MSLSIMITVTLHARASKYFIATDKAIEIVKQAVAEANDCKKTKTKADHVRSMSDEELAEFLCKVKSDYQWLDHEFPSEEESGEWEEWLQSEVEEYHGNEK